MALTEERITKLEAKGFKRWTKGNYDRLYINASTLGLDCDYYKSGNICGATFQGEKVSNTRAREMQAAKTYIDVKTGEVHSDNYTLEKAVQAIVEELDEQEAAEAAEITEQKTALEEAREILEGKITDENRELAEEVERIRNEGKEPETFSWAALLAGATKKAEAAETVTEQETAENKEGENTMKYFVDLDTDRFTLKTIDGHDTIYTGLLADAGIEGEDEEYTNKLDDFIQNELGIAPDEWEIG